MNKEDIIVLRPINMKKSIELINSKIKYQNKLLHILITIIILMIIGIIMIFIYYYILSLNYKNEISSKISYLEEIINNNKTKEINNLNHSKEIINYTNSLPNTNIIEFDEKMNEKYIQEQNNFCKNETFNLNQELANVIYKNLHYNMFIYKKGDIVSDQIFQMKRWEEYDTNNILKALNYYSNKKGIKNEDIYILDIGANIGWYSFTLAKYGYKIISFEPSELNNYILNKNYCLNKDVNITIINKGLYTEDKNCDYYKSITNVGNGFVFCDKNVELNDLKKIGIIKLTRLSNYIKFLSKKNLAFIKIDVEGSEGKAFEGGIEVITKYHVPFILLEYTPKALKLHDTDPLLFLQIFENNGYKIFFGIF